MTRIHRIVAVFALLLALVACTPQTGTSPTVPLPPTAQLAIADKALADAANTAVKALIAARNTGKISPADATAGELYAVQAARLSDDVASVLDEAAHTPNATMAAIRAKLLAQVTRDVLPAISGLSPTAAAIVQQVVLIVQQLTQQIGGIQ